MINTRIRTIGALAFAVMACECAADVPINGSIVTGNCTFFTAGINAGASIQRIAAGPDGNRWFTNYKVVGRLNVRIFKNGFDPP